MIIDLRTLEDHTHFHVINGDYDAYIKTINGKKHMHIIATGADFQLTGNEKLDVLIKKKHMTITEFMEWLQHQSKETRLVRMRMKDITEDEDCWEYKNELLLFDDCRYVWYNEYRGDFDRGNPVIEILGCAPISSLSLPGPRFFK